MKRGKDDEKSVEPMFPRLHVNDTERGGPRAPPRNKMALYEQLSIPSQRFNSGMMATNPNNCSTMNPSSASQGSGHELAMLFPRQLPPSVHRAEEPTQNTDLSPSTIHTGPKQRQEEDFTVPNFFQSSMATDPCVNNKGMDKERLSSYGPSYFNSQKSLNSKYFYPNQSCKEKSEGPLKQFSDSSTFKQMDHPTNLLSRLNNSHDSGQTDKLTQIYISIEIEL